MSWLVHYYLSLIQSGFRLKLIEFLTMLKPLGMSDRFELNGSFNLEYPSVEIEGLNSL